MLFSLHTGPESIFPLIQATEFIKKSLKLALEAKTFFIQFQFQNPFSDDAMEMIEALVAYTSFSYLKLFVNLGNEESGMKTPNLFPFFRSTNPCYLANTNI